MLISINMHFWGAEKIDLPLKSPGVIKFSKFYSSLYLYWHLLMWAKFHWKTPLGKRFFKFWSCDFFAKWKFVFLGAILNLYKTNFHFFFFAGIWLWLVYVYYVNIFVKVQLKSCFLKGGSMPYALTEGGSTLCSYVLSSLHFQIFLLQISGTNKHCENMERGIWA